MMLPNHSSAIRLTGFQGINDQYLSVEATQTFHLYKAIHSIVKNIFHHLRRLNVNSTSMYNIT